MKIIRPITIDDAILTSSDVPEDDYAEYVPATVYLTGTKVLVIGTVHKIYESLADANQGNYPPDNPAKWLDLGYDNRWRMFDGFVSTATTQADKITVTLQVAGNVDSIVLLNVLATSVKITVATSTGPEDFLTVFSEQFITIDDGPLQVQPEPITIESMIPANVVTVNAFETNKTDIVLTDLLVDYETPEIDVTYLIEIINNSGDAECGMCVVGIADELGTMLWSPSVGIIDYSVKTVDAFGNPTILKRGYSKRLSASLFVENANADAVVRRLAEYRATPVVWVGDPEFTSTILYGWYRDFDVVLESPAGSKCSIEIEGMI